MYRVVRKNKFSLKKLMASLFVVVTLASCASAPTNDRGALTESKKINDPIEPTNRIIFDFNQALDAAIFKPITGVYRDVIPDFIRIGVGNFIDNIKTPVVLANDVLQGEADRAGNTIMRFIINTSVGIAGVRDQATEWGFEGHDEDFGQTLAVWGVSEGPYIMLPILGPSNPRDLIGKVVDSIFDPINLWAADNEDRAWIPITRTVISGLNTRDQLWDVLNDLEKTSIDYYAAIRSLYRQRRNEDISNGLGSKKNKTPNLAESSELNGDLGGQKNSVLGL
jgi:phospholipid-binding lipoprotein MlaA